MSASPSRCRPRVSAGQYGDADQAGHERRAARCAQADGQSGDRGTEDEPDVRCQGHRDPGGPPVDDAGADRRDRERRRGQPEAVAEAGRLVLGGARHFDRRLVEFALRGRVPGGGMTPVGSSRSPSGGMTPVGPFESSNSGMMPVGSSGSTGPVTIVDTESVGSASADVGSVGTRFAGHRVAGHRVVRGVEARTRSPAPIGSSAGPPVRCRPHRVRAAGPPAGSGPACRPPSGRSVGCRCR